MKPSQMLLLLLGAVLAATSGCSHPYFFDGIVVDGDGTPIEGASISVYSLDRKIKSSVYTHDNSMEDGTFHVGWNGYGGDDFFRMTVAKKGFREQELIVEDRAKNLRIVLERIDTKAEAGASVEPVRGPNETRTEKNYFCRRSRAVVDSSTVSHSEGRISISC